MGDVLDHNLNLRPSPSAPQSYKHAPADATCKSEINIFRKKRESNSNLEKKLEEYYKRYEHDEVPVKDSEVSEDESSKSLTNSELDELEKKIYKNLSQDLQTDNYSLASLDSHVKFFKLTVQNILDNFYTGMEDFELYKKRFHDILSKKDVDAIEDMEEFIKDIIQHIISSETSLANDGKEINYKCDNEKNSDDAFFDFGDHNPYEYSNKPTSPSNTTLTMKTASAIDKSLTLIESFKNEDCFDNANILEHSYLHSLDVDSASLGKPCTKTLDMNDKKLTPPEENKTPEPPLKSEEVFNIYFLGSPCVQIKIRDHNPLSEINIKNKSRGSTCNKYVASAENMRRRAEKRIELQNYTKQTNSEISDKEIPVKVSYARSNLPYEDANIPKNEMEKSILSKFCDFLCRKFRRTLN